MKFTTYIPSDILQPYVRVLAIEESESERIYRVLPDTGLVMGFQYRGRLSCINDAAEIPLSASGITGLQNSCRIFKNVAGTGSVLVFFKPQGAAAFFKQPLHELFGESRPLDNLIPRSELLYMEEQLGEAGSAGERIRLVEAFLAGKLIIGEQDQLVSAAVSLISKSKGHIRIRDLALQLHTSQSPLEKRFRSCVGVSPKKFASIVRMKSAIQQYQPGIALTALGYEAGFYDQAHFIKEFKLFTGETPEPFFAAK